LPVCFAQTARSNSSASREVRKPPRRAIQSWYLESSTMVMFRDWRWRNSLTSPFKHRSLLPQGSGTGWATAVGSVEGQGPRGPSATPATVSVRLAAVAGHRADRDGFLEGLGPRPCPLYKPAVVLAGGNGAPITELDGSQDAAVVEAADTATPADCRRSPVPALVAGGTHSSPEDPVLSRTGCALALRLRLLGFHGERLT